jgi:ribosomal protein S18 acetylase RimI-like enzyme
VRRDLGDGYELDDDPDRVDVDAIHDFLSNHAYWSLGRPREMIERLVRVSQRVVSLLHDGAQVGYCRAVTDGVSIVYLADVYVLPEHRGRGLGVELVREMIEHGPYAHLKWILHTEDAHSLYRRFGFAEPSRKVMERLPPEPPSA